MSGMSHGWIGARALMNRRRSQKGRGGSTGSAAGGSGAGPGTSPPTSPTSPSQAASPTSPSQARNLAAYAQAIRDGYQPLDIEIKVTEPDSPGSPKERKGEAKKKGQELKKAVEEVFEETSRLADKFMSETSALRPTSACADPSYATTPGASTGGVTSPGGSSSSRRYSAVSPSVSRRPSFADAPRYDPRVEEEWRQLQEDLKVFAKMRDISIHGAWLSDNYGIGSYRYIHYSGYSYDKHSPDKQTKVLEGTVESIFTSTCCCCCVGCAPVAVRIFIKDANCDDVMTLKLTGDVTKFPMDTAQLQTPDGRVFATILWKKRTFHVKSTDGYTMFRLKLKRFWPCNLQWKHEILSGYGNHTIGWITAKNPPFTTEWSCGKILKTSIPRALDVRQKAAWVSLLFLMKLYNKGKEYTKVQLHDDS